MEPRADQTAEILERLRTGAAGHACAGFLTTLDPLHLADLLTGLVYDRLRRKYDAAAEIYRISGQNWNQTFYTLLFRYIGDLSNQDTYTELARRATYTMVLRKDIRCLGSKPCCSAPRDCSTPFGRTITSVACAMTSPTSVHDTTSNR